MKQQTAINSTILTMVLVLFSFSSSGQDVKKNEASVCFDVSLTCTGCEKTVMSNIAYEKGVKDVRADHVSKKVYIVYRPDKTDPEKLAGAIRKLGYSANIIEDDEGGCVREES